MGDTARRSRVRAAALGAGLALTVLTAAACSSTGTPASSSGHHAVVSPPRVVTKHHRHHRHSSLTRKQRALRTAYRSMKPASGFVGPDSVFAQDIRTAPLNPDSANLVDTLVSQVHRYSNGTADIGWHDWNTSFYRAQPGTRRITFRWDDCEHRTVPLPEFFDPAHGAVFVNVPVPAKARAAHGGDHHLSIWSPSTDQLWEFWEAHREANGWHACWGGRIDHWSTSNGVFPGWTGSTATGLSKSAGSIGVAEAQRGRIDHAISICIPEPENSFSYPASHSDGWVPSSRPHQIPEGMRFRLDPTLDLSTLHLNPITLAIARAAQTYGLIVADKGGSVAFDGEDARWVQKATGRNPWLRIFRNASGSEVLGQFPWDRMQALPFDYGKP